MKIAYFDLIAGASGDMILGALLDAGFELEVTRVIKSGFSATKLNVHVKDEVPERNLRDIDAIITSSNLPADIMEKSVAIFHRLGEVEAGIHGTSLDKVHLHELGGVDTIVDVVGVLLGLKTLGIERVHASPVPLSRGVIRGAHGKIPLPAPATVALLKGIPIVGSEIDKELVTPTGAVLLTSLADTWGQIPSMKLESVGYGAGGRDLPIPNILRVLIGECETYEMASFGSLVMLETNIDDMNPEIYNFLMDILFDAGALDVFITPIQMKKNRPAVLLQVLAKPDDASNLRQILFEETTTLGVRQVAIERYALDREIREIETPYGKVRVKVARFRKGRIKIAPEYEDCRKLADLHNIPIREIYQSAEFSFRSTR
jgi:uncharacterized protein (TIGR00299 family) protein